MKRIATCIVLILLGSLAGAYAQLSPGPLSKAHADLEGIRNCTLCHDLGDKVSDAKCLDCHKEIQSLISADRGYHASSEVKRKSCFECHSEHHGRNFDATRFDQDNFDHDLTGYVLEGQHQVIDCRECHKPGYIADPEIRKRENTFLGMEQTCLSCHEDYHQRTLSEDCKACHNIEAFRPAPGFDHNEADFALRGQHQSVDCKECHAIELRNGREFQRFSDVPFASCTDCHEDPHRQQLAGACTQCHDESGFSTFLGKRGFNHNQTGFILKGSHKQEDCFSCHAYTNNPLRVFQDQKGIAANNCAACHEDAHAGRYGSECARCHNEESFLLLNDMSFFDHSVTDYPLEGRHQQVDCRECHVERYSTPIDFSACQHCHEDYHQGEFAEDGHSPDCVECHSLEEGFEYSLYTTERHQESRFPLEGAHLATPCFACHISEDDERWTFRNIGLECVHCHTDIHEGFISETYYPEQNCQACHGNDSWAGLSFDHSLTSWPLDGAHLGVSCRECHFLPSPVDSQSYAQVFQGLSKDCISCHENVHGDEFAIDGVTDCTRCHVTESWLPEKFDHNLTAFPLEGRHAEIECRACHEVTQEDGTVALIYKLEKFECADCHK